MTNSFHDISRVSEMNPSEVGLGNEVKDSAAPHITDLKSKLEDIFSIDYQEAPVKRLDIPEDAPNKESGSVTLDDGTVVELPQKHDVCSDRPVQIEGEAVEDLGSSEVSSIPVKPSSEAAGVAEKDSAEKSDYNSSYKERLDRSPSETSDRGEWTGERGESTYIPGDEAIQELLAQFGLEGIEYSDGIPDFSKCSECTVEIDHMTEKRYGEDGNFAQCDEKAADQWNKEGRDGRTDWTAREVKKWREENGYSWHERNDMKTCDLVPTKVNDYFGHLGGVSECKKRDAAQNSGGDFDE